MGRFVNDETGVVISVNDSKDGRYENGWSSLKDGEEPTAPPAKKAAARKPAKKAAEKSEPSPGSDD